MCPENSIRYFIIRAEKSAHRRLIQLSIGESDFYRRISSEILGARFHASAVKVLHHRGKVTI